MISYRSKIVRFEILAIIFRRFNNRLNLRWRAEKLQEISEKSVLHKLCLRRGGRRRSINVCVGRWGVGRDGRNINY